MFSPVANAPAATEEKEVFVKTLPTIAGETCDACGHNAVGASYQASRGEKDLFFCAHHIRRFASKLQSDGFTIAPEDTSFTAALDK